MLNLQIFGVLMVLHSYELVIIAIAIGVGLILLGLLVRKMKELVIQKNEFKSLNASFLDIVNSTKDSFVLFDHTNRFSHANKEANWFLYEVLKADKSTFNLESIINQFNDLAGINISEQISNGDFYELPNLEIKMDNGEILNFYCRINPVVSKGKKQYTYILARNITDEILKHRIADENDFLISEVMNYSRDGFISIRKDYTIQSINPVAISVLNLNIQSILGESILTLIPEVENTDLITKCEYVLMQQEPLEFEYFFASQASWFNVKLLPNKYGLSFFFFENTTMKVNTALNDAERLALEDFSRRDVSFYQIMAKTIDSIQVLFPGMFCATYLLTEDEKELKFFSSGYSTFLPTVPKPIKDDFSGFSNLLQNKLKLEPNDVHFDHLNSVFSYKRFSSIFSQPIISENKSIGILISYFDDDMNHYSNISHLQEKTGFLIGKLFNYRKIFRDLEKLSIVSENSQKGFATINIDERITWSNCSFNHLFGAQREAILFKLFTDLIGEENTSFDNFEKLKSGVGNFENITMRLSYYRKDADPKELQLITRTIFSGDEVQLLIEIEDITEQVNYEQRLLQGREFLKKITDTVPIVLFQCEIDDAGQFNFMFLSKEIERFGVDLTAERIYKRPELIFRLIHPDDLPRVINTIEISQKAQITWNVEFRLEGRDNKTMWMKGIGVPQFQEDGRSVWFGYFENISDKKEKIKEIEAINTRFAYASKAVNEAIWEWDIEKNTLYWSDGLSSIFGYLRSNYPTLDNLYEYIHPDDYQEYAIQVQRNLDNKELELFSMEYRFKKPDGYFASIVDKGYIIRDNQGKAERVIGSIRDVSELRLFEKKKKELINETQEFERNQFSMELHDGLAQQLVALNLYISHLEEDIPADKRERIEICKKIVLDSLNQTRYLCYNLSPPELSNGLISGLKALFDRLNALNGIDFKFDYDNALTNDLFESIDIYNVYRIIQEFVNNSLKHSEGTEICCEIHHRPNQKSITVLIRDNGKGFDTSNINYGFGIQNIKKRANLAGAKIQMNSGLGEGCSLRMNLHYV
jgi:PAS domain S-box-containing protein